MAAKFLEDYETTRDTYNALEVNHKLLTQQVENLTKKNEDLRERLEELQGFE